MIRWPMQDGKLDWDAQYACALDPETARAIRDRQTVRKMTTAIHAVCAENSAQSAV